MRVLQKPLPRFGPLRQGQRLRRKRAARSSLAAAAGRPGSRRARTRNGGAAGGRASQSQARRPAQSVGVGTLKRSDPFPFRLGSRRPSQFAGLDPRGRQLAAPAIGVAQARGMLRLESAAMDVRCSVVEDQNDCEGLAGKQPFCKGLVRICLGT